MRRLGLRRRLVLALVAVVAVAICALAAGFNLLLGSNLSRNADNLARDRASAALALVHAAHGRLVVADSPDSAPDTPVWVFQHGRAIEVPDGGARLTGAARGVVRGYGEISSPHTRLYAAPVVSHGRRLGTVVAAVSLKPYDETRRTALIGSLIFAAALLLVVALGARWLVSSALRPVARMTRQAAAWGEADLEQRFAVGEPHDELTQLAATLDGLLDRLAASLRREQRFSSELSHELRTPLSRVIAETELALRRERTPEEYRGALEQVHANAGQLTRIVDSLVAAARFEAGAAHGTADAASVAAGAIEACSALAEERQIELDLDEPAAPLRIGIDEDLAERILQPLVQNACLYGRSRARIGISRNGDGVRFVIEDDGPGIDPAEREQIFEPGVRGLAGQNGARGAGLGLALARRLAHSASGEIAAVEGGFQVTLPAG